MSRPANKARGEVAISGFGDGAFLQFTIDSMERLQSAYSDKWLDTVLAGLADFNVPAFKTCIEVSLIGGVRADDKEAPLDFSGLRNLDETRDAIYDALFLQLYGKTFAEKKLQEEAEYLETTKKRLKEIDGDPHLAALIFSQQFGRPPTEPGSDLEKSAA